MSFHWDIISPKKHQKSETQGGFDFGTTFMTSTLEHPKSKNRKNIKFYLSVFYIILNLKTVEAKDREIRIDPQ